ncbi:hypothetical protein KKG05_04470 [bacterium]|nr:hypothetical protein [bacterium]MBU1936632.1 hypothetical protein [bacterium]
MTPNTLKELAKSLSSDRTLDLDSLKSFLEKASSVWADEARTHAVYETELQKEVQSRAELCGISQNQLQQMFDWPLTGQALLAFRREISRQFNERFKLSPDTATARQPEKTSPPLERWARFQSGGTD